MEKWYMSSWDPAKVSLTLKGLVPFALVAIKMFTDTDVSQSNVEDVIEKVLLFVTAGIAAYGAIRKLFKPQ